MLAHLRCPLLTLEDWTRELFLVRHSSGIYLRAMGSRIEVAVCSISGFQRDTCSAKPFIATGPRDVLRALLPKDAAIRRAFLLS
ncbi:MAG: hypothetical protein ACK56I_37305, partial [bacterium]